MSLTSNFGFTQVDIKSGHHRTWHQRWALFSMASELLVVHRTKIQRSMVSISQLEYHACWSISLSCRNRPDTPVWAHIRLEEECPLCHLWICKCKFDITTPIRFEESLLFGHEMVKNIFIGNASSTSPKWTMKHNWNRQNETGTKTAESKNDHIMKDPKTDALLSVGLPIHLWHRKFELVRPINTLQVC